MTKKKKPNEKKVEHKHKENKNDMQDARHKAIGF